MTIEYQNLARDIPPPLETPSGQNAVSLADAGHIIPIEWDCVIPYVIDSSIKYPEIVKEGIDYVNLVTDYTFKQRTDESVYMLFKDGLGCYTSLGRGMNQFGKVKTNVHEIIISQYCDKYAVTHEIGHALGLKHTMSRNDRDQYVKINPENMKQSMDNTTTISQYDKSDVLTIGDFDFTSNMIYNLYAFTNGNGNGKTMEPIVPVTTGKIGMRKGYSISDVQNINNKAYSKQCAAKSKPPPCNSTDIVFSMGEDPQGFVLPSGFYFKSSPTEYTGYNKFTKFVPKIIQNKENNLWEIIVNPDDEIYAQSSGPDIFTSTWKITTPGIKGLVDSPMTKVTVRDCTWPDLAGYNKDLPLGTRLYNFFTHNLMTINIVIITLAFVVIGLLFKSEIMKLFGAVSSGTVAIINRVRSASVQILPSMNLSAPRRNTI